MSAILTLPACPHEEDLPPPPPPPLPVATTVEGPAPPAPGAFLDWRKTEAGSVPTDWYADPYAPSTTVVWTAPGETTAGRVPPHGEVPETLPEGVGNVHLSRARAELMRDLVVLGGARSPVVRVGPDGATVHLAALQAVVGGYVVVYARLSGDSTATTRLGRTPSTARPALTLAGDTTFIAWTEGQTVRLANVPRHGEDTGAPALAAPAGVLAELVAPPHVLTLSPMAQDDEHRFSPGTARGTLAVHRLAHGKAPELLGAVPGWATELVGLPQAPLACGSGGCVRVPVTQKSTGP